MIQQFLHQREPEGRWVANSQFSPAKVVGLLLWLKADAIAGLADNAPVAVWPDSSGSAKDATQATAAKRPLYKAAKPSLWFDGDDWLESSENCNTKPVTVIAVVSVDDYASTRTIVGASANALQYRVDGTSGKQSLIKQGEVAVASSTSALAAATFTVVTMTYSAAGEWAFYKNGVADGAGTNDQIFATGVTIIGANNRLAEFMKGHIAEILKYDRVLAAVDRQAIENHLHTKYGIS